MLFAGALPGAFSKDLPVPTSVIGTYSGPWSSFYGSWTPVNGAAAWDTWGPLIGWYLSIAAFAVLLVGVILIARSRRELRQPATAPSATAPVTSAVPPTSSPPSPWRGRTGGHQVQ